MPVAGPFYFAWVDPTETTFGVEHHRMDEYVFSIKRTIAEGQKPLAEIEIQNPHVGLLNAVRKQWAWISWDRGYFTGVTGDGIEPLFFGHVVGVPTQLFEEVLTVQFVASPRDYKQRVQTVAESMKVLPWYDPVWIDVSRRDDPDTILEAYGKLWDVNPVTHVVTAVGIIEGPDGNVNLDGIHLYDSMTMTIGQPPATAILMDATVSWTQTDRGVVDIGSHSVQTLDGEGLMGQWPKPLQQLGNGWSVFYGNAVDRANAAAQETVTISYSWQSREKVHEDGDTMSISYSQTAPGHNALTGASGATSITSQTGVVDAFAVDLDGDPSPLNLPATFNASFMWVMGSLVDTSLVLQYDAQRPRTERVIFLVRANTQPVVVDPTIDQDSETLTLVGCDVGVPILAPLNWYSVAGEHVDVGQVVFPDNPAVPGGRSAQIAIVAGTAGTTVPDFSDVPGDHTVDGGVTWSSLGQASPPDNSGDWTPDTVVNAGTIICPKRPFFVTYAVLTQPLRQIQPQKQSTLAVSVGQIVQSSSGSFQVCTLGGETPVKEPSFSGTWGAVTTVGTAEWTSLGMNLPSGTTYQICTTQGLTGSKYVTPLFSETLHGTTSDNAAVWTCIGTGEIPIGGVTGKVNAPSYFTTDRGRQSLEHLGLRVRARLIYRARCVDIEFDVDYVTGVDITTRKTVTLHDPRIPGGTALGKVKSANLTASDSGVAACRVVISCTVGLNDAVESVDGDASYVDDNYVEDDYQVHDGQVILLPSGTDLSYEPLVYKVTDDGITFPVTRDQIVVVDEIRGSYNTQTSVASGAIAATAASTQPQLLNLGALFLVHGGLAVQPPVTISEVIKQHPIWVEYQFKPINPGAFFAVYNVKFSDLALPRGIDLQSETTT